MDGPSRARLDDYLRRLLQGRVIGDEDHGSFLEAHPSYGEKYAYPSKLSSALPDATGGPNDNTKGGITGKSVTLFECAFKPTANKGQGSWSLWKDHPTIQKYTVPDNAPFASIIVPTVDTVRNEWLMEIFLERFFKIHVYTD